MRDILKKYLRAISVILGVGLGALVLYLAVQEREQAQAVPNLGILQGRLPDGTYESSHIVRLYLNLDTFNLNQHMLYGSAKVEIEPHTYDAKNQPLVRDADYCDGERWKLLIVNLMSGHIL